MGASALVLGRVLRGSEPEPSLTFIQTGGAVVTLLPAMLLMGSTFPLATRLCREFYQYSLHCLAEDGVFVQWMPPGTLHRDFVINLRTLMDIFPSLSVFYFPPDSVLMVGCGPGTHTPAVGNTNVHMPFSTAPMNFTHSAFRCPGRLAS